MAYQFPNCEVQPLPDQQAVFLIDDQERLRWHFGGQYPRPFFYPLRGPSGAALTRMGHPGAANHDHHRSIWFAHAKVLGIDFWSDSTSARIRQKHWLCYRDGEDLAAMAVVLGWYDGHDPSELLEQELIVTVRPSEAGSTFVELHTTFRPHSETLEFGQTNFGFLAVRVAKSISAYFGGGELTNSQHQRGEPAIFGQPARWMDYSGPVRVRGSGDAKSRSVVEGITYFDHPNNPSYPAHWHVREDGWMGSAPCMHQSLVTTRQRPLVFRYLLHAHGGDIDAGQADRIADDFAARPSPRVVRSTAPHQGYEIE